MILVNLFTLTVINATQKQITKYVRAEAESSEYGAVQICLEFCTEISQADGPIDPE